MVFLINILTILFMNIVQAQVKFDCKGTYACEFSKELESQLNDGEPLDLIVEKVRSYSLRQNAIRVEYVFSEDPQKPSTIFIHDKYVLDSYNVTGMDEVDAEMFLTTMPFRPGDFLPRDAVEQIAKKFLEVTKDYGNEGVRVNIGLRELENSNEVVCFIETFGFSKILVGKVIHNIDPEKFPIPARMLQSLTGSRYFKNLTEIEIDNIEKEFVRLGYSGADITWEVVKISPDTIQLMINADIKEFSTYSIEGNKQFSRDDILSNIKKQTKDSTSLDPQRVKKIVEDMYREKGFYNVDIRIQQLKGNAKENSKNYFYMKIVEGKRLRLKSVEFSGNYYIEKQSIVDLFQEKSTVLIENNFVDFEYLRQFTDILRKKYRSSGFLVAEISDPQFKIDDSGVEVIYNIIERIQTTVEKIEFSGLTSEIANRLREQFKIKEGTPFDVTLYEEEVKGLISKLKENGYYFSTLKEENLARTLFYSRDVSRLTIKLNFLTGYKIQLANVIISGLAKTKDKVVLREVHIEKGELISPKKIEDFRVRLESLNLFSSIKVNIININPSTDNIAAADLMISVSEKDFGYGEIAPGYRTDLGLKLSSAITYSNVLGLNHGFGVKFQVNQRLDYGYLDLRRRSEEKRIFEYFAESTYRWPYIISNADFFLDASFQRKRFYAFDADIFKVAPRLHKDLTERISIGLQYQFETVNPFDASEEKDRDSFKIGSITPSISYDRRDNKVRPTKGLSLSLSWERASPNFGAQNTEDLKIDFYKLVTRNRAYFSVGDFTFAFFASAGVARNLANEIRPDSVNEDGSIRTQGYIPSIKVFRLDGLDTIRGYSESEINRLKSGININQVRVQDRAFFNVFKFEPRYSLSDATILGVFFDAGRLSVNGFQPLDLRTSTGLSFKYVTPVGTLDFDYGVKLKREKLEDGGRESFGRFHLSIGVF